jgi:FtsH-binding integral membrane protein
MTDIAAAPVPAPAPVARKRHPIRGAIAGLLLGLGVIILLIVYGKATFTSSVPFLIILLVGLVLGILVGLFGPARKAKNT